MSAIKIETNLNDLDDQLRKVSRLIESLNEMEDKVTMIRFLTIQEFSEISGWSLPVVKNLFNRADFPSCDYGKKKIVEVSAAKKYFSVPRRK